MHLSRVGGESGCLSAGAVLLSVPPSPFLYQLSPATSWALVMAVLSAPTL